MGCRVCRFSNLRFTAWMCVWLGCVSFAGEFVDLLLRHRMPWRNVRQHVRQQLAVHGQGHKLVPGTHHSLARPCIHLKVVEKGLQGHSPQRYNPKWCNRNQEVPHKPCKQTLCTLSVTRAWGEEAEAPDDGVEQPQQSQKNEPVA